MSELGDENHPEAKVRIRERRVIAIGETPGRPTVRHIEIVSAAANDFQSERIGRRTGRIQYASARQISQPILRPLPIMKVPGGMNTMFVGGACNRTR